MYLYNLTSLLNLFQVKYIVLLDMQSFHILNERSIYHKTQILFVKSYVRVSLKFFNMANLVLEQLKSECQDRFLSESNPNLGIKMNHLPQNNKKQSKFQIRFLIYDLQIIQPRRNILKDKFKIQISYLLLIEVGQITLNYYLGLFRFSQSVKQIMATTYFIYFVKYPQLSLTKFQILILIKISNDIMYLLFPYYQKLWDQTINAIEKQNHPQMIIRVQKSIFMSTL
ncbi:hypothetical protein pb186bvf_010482 [Paramecium bursaria]